MTLIEEIARKLWLDRQTEDLDDHKIFEEWDWKTIRFQAPMSSKSCYQTVEFVMNELKSHGYVRLAEEQKLPEIPDFIYDFPEDRPLLRRGAINYSKLLAGFKRVERDG